MELTEFAKKLFSLGFSIDEILVKVMSKIKVDIESAVEGVNVLPKEEANKHILNELPGLISSFNKKETKNHIFDVQVLELDLSNKMYNILLSENIVYIGDLVRRTERELKIVPGLGDKRLKEIKDFLATQDLSLGMKVVSWKRPED